MDTRIGFGWDSHAFKPGVPLRIGGMTLDHPEGLAGHSDGDVLLHAITDALLGAVAAGDIGSFFPPGDPRWKDADSAIFLNLALEELQHAGYRIVNVDTTLVLAAPKISPIAGEMRVARRRPARPAHRSGEHQGQNARGAEPGPRGAMPRRSACGAQSGARRLKSISEVIETPAPARGRGRRSALVCPRRAQAAHRAGSTTPRTLRSQGSGVSYTRAF